MLSNHQSPITNHQSQFTNNIAAGSQIAKIGGFLRKSKLDELSLLSEAGVIKTIQSFVKIK